MAKMQHTPKRNFPTPRTGGLSFTFLASLFVMSTAAVVSTARAESTDADESADWEDYVTTPLLSETVRLEAEAHADALVRTVKPTSPKKSAPGVSPSMNLPTNLPPLSFKSTAALSRTLDNVFRGAGDWAYASVLVRPDGSEVPLVSRSESVAMIPASTMKLFTGWLGFQERLRTDNSLGSMLQRSLNRQAKNLLTDLLHALGLQKLSSYTAHAQRRLGLGADTFRVVDGAGYSNVNRASASDEIQLLRTIRYSADYIDFRNLLAQPELSPSTLARRFDTAWDRDHQMRDRLYAKTGTLPETRVSALAGFLRTRSGTVLFSFLGNRLTHSIDTSEALVDRAIRAHVRFIERE